MFSICPLISKLFQKQPDILLFDPQNWLFIHAAEVLSISFSVYDFFFVP